jgi:glycosyltransferase involved in cell wall biosynthesis
MLVSVVLPVGPNPSNQRWLREAIDSVVAQDYEDGVFLQLVDDMADLEHSSVMDYLPNLGIPFNIYEMPWYSGVAHAFNAGVAQSPSEWNLMLGSDDWLEPNCVTKCVAEYTAKHGDPYGYFYVGVRYSDTGETQDLACHAAMVSKSSWRKHGGFPIQSSSGAPDAALLSVIIGNYPRAGRHWQVAGGVPLYNYRRHADTDTASKASWQGVILETRDLVTREWRPRDE